MKVCEKNVLSGFRAHSSDRGWVSVQLLYTRSFFFSSALVLGAMKTWSVRLALLTA